MKRFSVMAAALSALSISVVPAATAEAGPRGRAKSSARLGAQAQARAQAPGATTDRDAEAEEDAADSDGPEARGVALAKLDDIIEIAVRQSPDIARAKVDREAAHEAAGGARREQAWIVSAEAQYQRNAIGADTADTVQPLSQIAEDKVSGSLGIARALPTGGNLGAQLGISHQRQEILVTGETFQQALDQHPAHCPEGVDVLCQDQVSATVTLKQPLARGLGPSVALANERRADLSAAEATVKAQLAAEQLLRDVVAAYWELAYAANEVDVRAESLELAKRQDQITRQEMRAGTAPSNSVDAVTYELAVRDEALITAKLQFEKKSLELRRKAGLEIGRRDIAIRPNEPFEIDTQEWNVEDVLTRSHKINRQLATIVLQKKLADVDVEVARDATLPQLDLSLSGGVNGTGATAGAAFSGLSDSSGGGGFGYQVMAGVSFSFEVSGAARSAHKAALARRRRLDIDRADLERQIDAEVVTAAKALVSGRTRVALTDKAIQVAEDNVKAERARFQAQRSDNFQVMERQTQLIDARLRRGRAVADYHIAVAHLQFLSGTLLEAHRVRVR